MKIDPKIGDNVKCSDCGKEFVFQIDSESFDGEDLLCQDCVNEWEE